MESPYYDRLEAVADLSLDDSAELKRYVQMAERIDEVRAGLKRFAESVPEMLQGQAGDAIAAAATSMMNDIASKESSVVVEGVRHHQAARAAMWEAKSSFADLSEDLVSPGFAKLVKTAGSVLVPGVGTVLANVYLDNLAASNNDQREEAARQILDSMRAKIETVSELPPIDVRPVPWGKESGSGNGKGPGDLDNSTTGVFTGSDMGSSSVPSGSGLPSGGLAGWLAGTPGYPGVSSGSGWSPSQGSGSPSVGLSWPDSSSPGSEWSPWSGSGVPSSSLPGSSSLVGSSWSGPSAGVGWGVVPVVVTLPNGSTVGVVPASVVDSYASSWKSGYSTVPVSSVQSGGLSMAGWAGTNPGGAGGIGGVGSGAGGMGAARAGVGGPGQFGSSGSGVGGAGLGGARASGTMGVGGSGAPGAGAAGEAGAAGAGSRGGMMPPGAGGASSQDEKLKRRKYKAFKFRADRDPEDWGELPPGAGPGRAEDLPARRAPEDEEYPW